MEDLRDLINRFFNTCQIDHATWCNALRYIDGDYDPVNHKLARNAFLICWDLVSLHSDISSSKEISHDPL